MVYHVSSTWLERIPTPLLPGYAAPQGLRKGARDA